MATRATTPGSGHIEGPLALALRAVGTVLAAVGEGMKARNDYNQLVGRGEEPAKAAAEAVLHLEARH